MSSETLKTVCSAQETVAQLVEACRKEGRLYQENPKSVAQVSRTGKWLLNAITALRQTLGAPGAKKTKK
jgi:hypothetical protein